MSRAAETTVYDDGSGKSALLALLFVAGSVVFHVVGFVALNLYVESRPPPVFNKPMDLVMIDVKPPPPSPPPPEEKKEEPPPPPKKVKPPPIKVARVTPPPEEIPKEQPPPPPNEEPKEQTKPVPLVVGISMSSTTSTGNFAAAVGNTQYGKTADRAVDPAKVEQYRAPKYLPSYQVDTQPEVMADFKPPYPDEARKAGIEGQIILQINVDADGKVTTAKIIRGLGYGLDEAALTGIKRFKFRPAVKGGEAVSTTINYTFTFLLD